MGRFTDFHAILSSENLIDSSGLGSDIDGGGLELHDSLRIKKSGEYNLHLPEQQPNSDLYSSAWDGQENNDKSKSSGEEDKVEEEDQNQEQNLVLDLDKIFKCELDDNDE